MTAKFILPFMLVAVYIHSQEKDSLGQSFSMAKSTVSFVAGTNYIDNSFGLKYNRQLYELKANDAFYAEFFLRYRWLDTTFSFAPKFLSINNDSQNKGDTKYFNLGFAFFPHKQVRQYLGFSRMKGLYLEDSRRFFADAIGVDESLVDFKDNFIFPKATYLSFQGETSYLWKGNKENYRSFTNMTYQPLKNEWIIMTGLVYQYNIMKNTNVVEFQGNLLEDSSESSSGSDLRIALKSGAGMQKIFAKNWYVIAEAYPQFFYAKIISENKYDFNVGLNSVARLGFDNGKFFGGISGIFNWTNNNNEDFYSFTHWQARIGFGIRFNSPKFAEKTFDFADSKINKITKKNGN